MSLELCGGKCEAFKRITHDFSGPLSTHPEVIVVTQDADPSDSTTWEYNPSSDQRLRAANNFLGLVTACEGPNQEGHCGVYPNRKCSESEGLSIFINIDLEQSKKGE